MKHKNNAILSGALVAYTKPLSKVLMCVAVAWVGVGVAAAQEPEGAALSNAVVENFSSEASPAIPSIVQPVEAPAAPPESAAEAAKKQKEKQTALNKKAASAYKGLFFENDFSYLCDPEYSGFLLGERMKKRCLPGGGTYDFGGQVRLRGHFEQNMRGLGLTGDDDKFLLYRTRLYSDLKFTPNLRVFAEFIDAESNYENFAPRGIEVNRADMLNLFVDAKLMEGHRGSLTARVGRQEFLYDAQRLVSPLDWANTRRTFEGARLMFNGKNRKIDAFWANPIRTDDQQFDSPDRDQEFMGVHSTYTGRKDVTVDTYFLRYLNGRGANDFKFNTIGTRFKGKRGELLYELEGAYQFGLNSDGSDHSAGMLTLGFGKEFTDRCWKPTAWLYYDYASGDGDTGAGKGFHHNFPLAHKYFGFIDLFGRRNIEDVNLLLTAQPTKRLKLLAWYHYMFLATQSDTPYQINMAAFNPGNAPGSTDLGHEIDFVATYGITARQSVLFGYSHFFHGEYYRSTAGVPFVGDADFFYTQYTVNF